MFHGRLGSKNSIWGALLFATLATPRVALADQLQMVRTEVAPRLARQNAAGTPAPSQTLHIVFSLSGVKADQLEAYAQSTINPASPNFHHWLTPAQVGTQFGAPQADIDAVVSYAKSQGMTVNPVSPSRLLVSASAPVQVTERALSVRLTGYERTPDLKDSSSGDFYFAPSTSAQLPVSVASKISAVFGLSNAVRFKHSQVSMRPVPTASVPHVPKQITVGPPIIYPPTVGTYFNGLTPAQLSSFYDIDTLHMNWNGQGHTIAIFSLTGINLGASVLEFAAEMRMPSVSVSEVSVDGGNFDLTDEGEACLDGEVVLGQAPGANVVYYEAPNGLAEYIDLMAKIQTDNVEVVTDSWGSLEAVAVGRGGFIAAVDTVLAAMGAQGIAHFNSSGDNGSIVNFHGGPSYPNTNPNVTSVGGTQNPSSVYDKYDSEEGWFGSGGGLSTVYPIPVWQAGPGVTNSFSTGFRQVPDVAALGGDPGYAILIEDQWELVEGTSASTPLWASVQILMNQATNSRIGNMNASLYDIGTNLSGGTGFAFHDILTGNNGSGTSTFNCTPGWDFVTGLGSADFGRLYADLFLKPDLAPGLPANFSSPVLLSTSSSTQTSPSFYHETIPYFVSGGIRNNGPADARACASDIFVDSTTHHVKTAGPFGAVATVPIVNWFSQTFTAGVHTFKLTVNSASSISETSTANNSSTTTITVLPAFTGFTVPATGVSGTPLSVTFTLSSPAPAGGAVIKIVSSIPSDFNTQLVTIPAGSSSLTVSLSTIAVGVSTPQTLTATYGAMKKTAPVTLN